MRKSDLSRMQWETLKHISHSEKPIRFNTSETIMSLIRRGLLEADNDNNLILTDAARELFQAERDRRDKQRANLKPRFNENGDPLE